MLRNVRRNRFEDHFETHRKNIKYLRGKDKDIKKYMQEHYITELRIRISTDKIKDVMRVIKKVEKERKKNKINVI